jgi:hypothetical protein
MRQSFGKSAFIGYLNKPKAEKRVGNTLPVLVLLACRRLEALYYI